MILDSLGLPKTFKLVNPVHHNLPFTRSSDIHKWDFSTVTIRLVASIGGGGKDGWNAMDKIGQCRLSKILRDEGWVARPGQALKSLEAQVSLSTLQLVSRNSETDIHPALVVRVPRSATTLRNGQPSSSRTRAVSTPATGSEPKLDRNTGQSKSSIVSSSFPSVLIMPAACH